MVLFADKYKEYRTNHEMGSYNYVEVPPPLTLDEKYFEPSGKGNNYLLKILQIVEATARDNPTVKNRIDDYWKVKDILVIGGKAQGKTSGDLDLYIQAYNTSRGLSPASTDYKDLNVAITRDFNGTDNIGRYIKVRGKDSLVDVYISNTPPLHTGVLGNDGMSSPTPQFFSSKFNCWVQINPQGPSS